VSNKRKLTAGFVDSQAPPATGELWFPDTEIKGFGLRLWAGVRQGGMAYCLRAKYQDGRMTRRQFDPCRHGQLITWGKPDTVTQSTLGDWLEVARNWARAEREKLAGATQTETTRYKARLKERDTLRASSLGNILDTYLKSKYSDSGAQHYIDFINNTIFEFIPMSLQQKTLAQISAEELAAALVQADRAIHKMIALNGLLKRALHQITFDQPELELGSEQLETAFHNRMLKIWSPNYLRQHDLLKTYKQPVLEFLNAQPIECIPAAFLQFYLRTGSKQNPLLAARWDRINDGVWFPYLPQESKSWFLMCEELDEELLEYLVKYRQALVRDVGETPYLFPSVHRGAYAYHITSVQRYWKRMMRQLGWREEAAAGPSLKQFAGVCCDRNRLASDLKPRTIMRQTREIEVENSYRHVKFLSKLIQMSDG